MEINEKFQEYLQGFFTEENERIFLEHFQQYSQYCNRKDEFIINFDTIYEYIGFTTKANAKRLLVKSFTDNIDYQISLPKDENYNSLAGRPSEIILMKSETFKELCLLANTQKGKETRKYYIKMESMFMDYIINENVEFMNKNKDFMNQIEELTSEIEKKQRKKYEYGDTIYIEKDNSIHNLYKIGSTDNMNTREKSYKSHTITGEIIYTKRCNNRKILENAVQHIIRSYTYKTYKDWFIIDFEFLKQIIENTQVFMDNNPLITIVDKTKINNEEILANPNNEIVPINEILPNKKKPKTNNKITNNEIEPNNNDIESPDLSKIQLRESFDKFIDECFTLEPPMKSYWIDITARYRLWSKSTNEIRLDLAEYLKSKGFDETFSYDTDSKMNSIAYKGIKMKPLSPLILSENPSEIEKFMVKKCVRNVTGRLSCKDLWEEFVEWKNDPQYKKINQNDKTILNKYCNDNFLPANVHTGERIRFGFYGVSFIGKENVGRKNKTNNRKIVEQVEVATNNVINTYDSITHAAAELGVYISTISMMISRKRVTNGCLLRIKI